MSASLDLFNFSICGKRFGVQTTGLCDLAYSIHDFLLSHIWLTVVIPTPISHLQSVDIQLKYHPVETCLDETDPKVFGF